MVNGNIKEAVAYAKEKGISAEEFGKIVKNETRKLIVIAHNYGDCCFANYVLLYNYTVQQ